MCVRVPFVCGHNNKHFQKNTDANLILRYQIYFLPKNTKEKMALLEVNNAY